MFGRKPSSKSEFDRDPQSAYEMIQENVDNPDFILLDVRTPQEFSQSHIKDAKLLDFQAPDFKTKVQELDKNKTYLVYCRSGMRSAGCADTMKSLGFNKVYNLVGGIMAWEREGLPVE
ncbi:rhodanese-like domain-containing protein [Methanobacterium sp. BAmetb5]|jgi:rhodanese-related sulfurtransferase|uniref:rhodanese-like domain-containing protein n=1 Tax=Methanobacterium sp. BAmetb5 TaxID=2025351 RepID=UPI000E949FCD|nr:rhodanese-like domain-containing protein [Methanobacterium sp. BAmetb5]AXV39363.1 MAG: sulfurtransferase [Methanobacterium sp. BAmetb5]